MNGFTPIEACRRDIRTAIRRLTKTPGFVVLAVLSLGLGIGIPTAVYSAIHATLWAPLGVREARDVVVVQAGAALGDIAWEHAVSFDDFTVLQKRATTYQALAGSAQTVHTAELVPGDLLSVQGEIVAGRYFPAVGVQPLVGRLLDEADDSESTKSAVLSEAFWRTRFGADPAAVGKTISLDGQTFQVVGVTPKGFIGVHAAGLPTEIWTHHSAYRARLGDGMRGPEPRVTVLGRLKPGVPPDAATAELTHVAADLDRVSPVRDPGSNRPSPRIWTARAADSITRGPESVSRFGVAIVGTMILVMLVASTNLANLFLARSTLMKRELMLRRALGASWISLLREQTVAGVVLAVAGCVTGLMITGWLLSWWAVEISSSAGRGASLSPDLGSAAVLFAVCAASIALIIFSTLPAIHILRRLPPLSAAGDRFTPTPVHGALIRFQVMVSVCLFLAATAGVRYVLTAANRDTGVALGRLALATVYFGAPGDSDPADVIRTVGARGTGSGPVTPAWASGLPFGVNAPAAQLSPVGNGARMGSGAYYVVVAATREIFETLGVPLVAGRTFGGPDDEDSAVLSVSAAQKLFGSDSPVGRQVQMTMPGSTTKTRTIIGLAADTDVVHFGSRNGAVAYVPLASPLPRRLTAVLNATEPERAAEMLRLALHRASPTARIETAGSGEALMTGPFRVIRFAALLASALGTVALVLSMIGLYGVLSLSVASRSREIGVRSALGASPRTLIRLFLREGLTPVFQGLMAGLGIGTLARVALNTLLGVSVAVIEPVSLLLVAGLLCLAGAAACYFPARRAASVNPTVVLQDL